MTAMHGAAAGDSDDPPAVAGAERWPRGLLAVAAAAVLLWLLVCWPLIAGRQTFFYRDLFGHFAPLKAFGAMQLQAGAVPALNSAWALGQPFRGDPVASAFYPGNVLYLLLPFWVAFNLHLCLHWLLGGVAMTLFARRSGRSHEAACLAGLAYAGGGWMLSALSLYHIVAVAAWWPLVLLGALRGGRRGVALGGLCCGLALLAGEPFTAVLGIAPLVLVAVAAWGWRRGVVTATAIGALGLLVAAPQAVASARVLPFTFRGTHGVLASQAETYKLHPARLLELAAPLPFGAPGRPATGSWSQSVVPYTPFYYSLYPGAVATFLALLALRRRPTLAVLALLGVLLAWSPGISGRMLTSLVAGLFRSPEKAIFWLALAWPLLAAGGLDEVRGGGAAAGRRAMRLGAVLGGTLLLAAATVAVATARGATTFEPTLPRALAASGLVVLLAAWALWRGLAVAVVAFQLVALLPLQPLLLTESVTPYERAPPWATPRASGSPQRAVLPLEYTYPAWQSGGDAEPPAARARRLAFELGPVPGVLFGLTYPLAPDLDGMHHRFFDYLLFRASQDDWPRRLPWLRKVGVEAITASQPIPTGPDGPRLVAIEPWGRESSYLYTLHGSAPAAWWPRRVTTAANPAIAYEQIAADGQRAEPTETAVLPFAVPHAPDGLVRLLSSAPDRVEIAVSGGGGVAVVRRAFQPLWRARTGTSALQVIPVDLALTGVVVPPGEHRVELYVSPAPEWMAAAVALATLLALIVLLLVPARVPAVPRWRTAPPP